MYLLRIAMFSCSIALVSSECVYTRAEAASFNCGRASDCTEAVICATPQLSSLDSRMSSLYGELQSFASRRGARRLLNSQRAWLDNRDSCGCNANCLVSSYTSRIRLFNEALGY
jgi:uncharacterized protein